MIRHQPLFNTTPIESHAIVIGGSIAGMFAARVLSNYFTQITVIDRDTFPDVPAHHKGAPHHVHRARFTGHGKCKIGMAQPLVTPQCHAQDAEPLRSTQLAICGAFPQSELLYQAVQDRNCPIMDGHLLDILAVAFD